MDLKIQTGFIGKSEYFLKNESYRFNKERIYERVDNFSMLSPGMLIDDNLILDEEMGNIVIKVNCFRNSINTNQFITTTNCKTIEL